MGWEECTISQKYIISFFINDRIKALGMKQAA